MPEGESTSRRADARVALREIVPWRTRAGSTACRTVWTATCCASSAPCSTPSKSGVGRSNSATAPTAQRGLILTPWVVWDDVCRAAERDYGSASFVRRSGIAREYTELRATVKRNLKRRAAISDQPSQNDHANPTRLAVSCELTINRGDPS